MESVKKEIESVVGNVLTELKESTKKNTDIF